jgi:acid phosphatase family membrane protein YuiD
MKIKNVAPSRPRLSTELAQIADNLAHFAVEFGFIVNEHFTHDLATIGFANGVRLRIHAPSEAAKLEAILWSHRTGVLSHEAARGALTTSGFASRPGFPTGRGLAAVVFTDVVGYSSRMQRDETGTMALVKADFALMSERCAEHSGELLNTMGDGGTIPRAISERFGFDLPPDPLARSAGSERRGYRALAGAPT